MGLYAKARGSYVGAKRQLSGSSSAGDAGGNTRRVSGAPAGSGFRSILPPPYPGIRSATDEGPRAVPDLWADTALIVQRGPVRDMLRLKLSISLNPRISSGRPWRFVVSI